MPLDLIGEQAIIDLSRAQRQAWERMLLLVAGISPDEATRIAEEAARDRAAFVRKEAA